MDLVHYLSARWQPQGTDQRTKNLHILIRRAAFGLVHDLHDLGYEDEEIINAIASELIGAFPEDTE